MNQKTVFFPILNMGLGHASRSLPLIRALIARQWNVIIGSNGRALAFLKGEVPNATFMETPAYNLQYSKRGWFAAKLFVQSPRLFRKVFAERRFIKKLVRDKQIDLIISDQCYGMYHSAVPSYFISHQIIFEVPAKLWWLKGVLAKLNALYHYRFKEVWIPDMPSDIGQTGLLSGELSRVPEGKSHYRYIGFLASVSAREMERDIDLFVSVSGPEPQRTLLEKIVLKQVPQLPGRKVVVLGKPESQHKNHENNEQLSIYSHLNRDRMQEILNRSKLVLSRSGYSTIMELIELNTPALFIPTPGQTEQVYLAELLRERKWYFSVEQENLNLLRDLENSRDYQGFSLPNATEKTIESLFNDIPELRDYPKKTDT